VLDISKLQSKFILHVFNSQNKSDLQMYNRPRSTLQFTYNWAYLLHLCKCIHIYNWSTIECSGTAAEGWKWGNKKSEHIKILVTQITVIAAEAPTSIWVGNHKTQKHIRQSTLMMWFQCFTLKLTELDTIIDWTRQHNTYGFYTNTFLSYINSSIHSLFKCLFISLH
jgi:hypothetical protein